MRFLKSSVHTDLIHLDLQSPALTIYHRQATRAIVLNGDNILMLYTARYHDYTLPGGGIDAGEDQIQGLIRELEEETGAMNIHDIEPFGLYEEYRPWHKPEHDIVHMESFCYMCKIDAQLGSTRLEDYEQKNGMKPVWINIFDAIAHNEQTMLHSDKKGMSIERETFLLKRIVSELLAIPAT
ncbi:NUDIX hydrolase [Photobacterium phosphoreum]|uniref:NUDIX hydrolase n=1 Tax=Photobacterium phosphoreum TaxID=659 RepID=UPI000D1601E8|nr:NUDIX hydrolase [Photobacterium phosphoreum]MCD9469132.1 DNA mismatch repair protein MutT [Photobacterium phosphoreum]PSU73745.1 DNA mismatch repair protein MutT [Photobacterium phosphoreum]PSW14943.1 DNA mismatch repair protein MutT [Photobacterium phosphoreum]PSW30743.1 DNA mismatch repair protein MutT [Photobacterium phosphoreum]